MSDPSPTAPPPPPPPALSHLPLVPTTSNREYRKGNWTIQETLTLIIAKKLDDERRSKPTVHSSAKPGELRWKWVENYCWAHGCFRSQNQCNDKWDNLLRDYKKIREYENSRSNVSDPISNSYWTMERHQRKYHNLPSNMSLEVFEALNEVVQKRYRDTQPNITTQQDQQQQQQQQFFIAASPAPVIVRQPPVVDSPAAPGTLHLFLH